MKTNKAQIRKAYKALQAKLLSPDAWYEFISKYNRNDVSDVLKSYMDARDRLRKYQNSHYYAGKIKKYCNFHGYSDVEAYEVVKVISPITVEVRELNAKLITKMEWVSGGFAGHCVNNYGQEYEFSSNPENSVRRIRFGKKGWDSGRFRMSDHPHKHYDYNF